MSGKLFIIATPIGNLKDITQRAIETLEYVDIIACEDTRHSHTLLAHLNIQKPLVSLHRHNENKAAQQLIEKIAAGSNVAVISDAGTPVISDPGAAISKLAHAQQIPVIPIPGASAVMSALSASGLSGDQFIFAGFIPAKHNEKVNFLQTHESNTITSIFFETPHRIKDTLKQLHELYQADRKIVIAREMTKTFEQIVRLKIEDSIHWIEESANHCRGEFVILIEGKSTQQVSALPWQALADDLVKMGLSTKDCAQIVAKYTGEKKKIIYQQLINSRDSKL